MINFIETWENKVSEEDCDSVIEVFESDFALNSTRFLRDGLNIYRTNMSREDCSTVLDDIFAHANNSLNFPEHKDSSGSEMERKKELFDNLMSLIDNKSNLCHTLYKALSDCYHEYRNKYGQLLEYNHECSNLKVQRTLPYGGYHTWHYEQGHTVDLSRRELVWTLYLNTMPPNEAETEFLYQGVKLQPKKGMIVIFPAAMTHVHRGLTVYTQPKYIITGWFAKILTCIDEKNP